MEQKNKERKGGAALPAFASVAKVGKTASLAKILLASPNIVMGLAGALGIATVGGFHAYENGAQQRKKPTISQFAAAKVKADKSASGKVLTERAEPSRMLATDNAADLASNASTDFDAGAAEEAAAGEEEAVDAPAGEAEEGMDAASIMGDIDLSALAEDEDSRAANALAAKMKNGGMPKMKGGLSGLGGISGGSSGASASSAKLAKLSAARSGGAARSASAGAGRGKTRGLSRARGKSTGGARKGGASQGGSRLSSADKLRSMGRKFKGASGSGDTKKDYSTQQAAWDSGRGGVSTAGGGEGAGRGSAGSASNSSGGAGGFFIGCFVAAIAAHHRSPRTGDGSHPGG